jgi:hypothetical protein
VSRGYLLIKLSCQAAPCSGSATVTERVVVKTHKGNKPVSKEQTLVLAQADYTIKMGQRATVDLKLSSSWPKTSAGAKGRLTKEEVCVTVRGGTTMTKMLRISS